MFKKASPFALALILMLVLIPATALAAIAEKQDPNDDRCTIIWNTQPSAEKLVFGQRTQIGKNSVGERFPYLAAGVSADYHYYNVELWYEFDITTDSEITILGEAHERENDERNYNQIWYYLRTSDAMQPLPDIGRQVLGNGGIRAGGVEDPLKTTNYWKLLPGKYYLYFDPASANNDYGWITVTTKATQPDFGGEPNDTILQAKTIQANTTYQGNLNYWGKPGNGGYYEYRDEHDYYKFVVPYDGYGAKLTASCANGGKKNNIDVYLCSAAGYPIDGMKIGLQDNPSGACEYKNLKKGTYYVHFDGGAANAYETEYTFRLDETSKPAVSKIKLAKPGGLKLTAKKASWKKVANNNGYTLKIKKGSKVIKTVQIKKNKTSYAIPKKLLKKGGSYKFTLVAKGTGSYDNSPAATSKAFKKK